MKIISFIERNQSDVIETRSPGMGEEHRAKRAPKGCTLDGCSEHTSSLWSVMPRIRLGPFQEASPCSPYIPVLRVERDTVQSASCRDTVTTSTVSSISLLAVAISNFCILFIISPIFKLLSGSELVKSGKFQAKIACLSNNFRESPA